MQKSAPSAKRPHDEAPSREPPRYGPSAPHGSPARRAPRGRRAAGPRPPRLLVSRGPGLALRGGVGGQVRQVWHAAALDPAGQILSGLGGRGASSTVGACVGYFRFGSVRTGRLQVRGRGRGDSVRKCLKDGGSVRPERRHTLRPPSPRLRCGRLLALPLSAAVARMSSKSDTRRAMLSQHPREVVSVAGEAPLPLDAAHLLRLNLIAPPLPLAEAHSLRGERGGAGHEQHLRPDQRRRDRLVDCCPTSQPLHIELRSGRLLRPGADDAAVLHRIAVCGAGRLRFKHPAGALCLHGASGPGIWHMLQVHTLTNC
jgi:hypothetical protein